MIYVNTTIPLEELSKNQEHIEKGKKIKVQTDYMEKKNKERYKTNHSIWSKLNKDSRSNYREDNRERIREQYKQFIERKTNL